MRKRVSIVVLGILVAFTGCIPSLHPIYTGKDIVFEPSLIGQWAEDNSKEVLTFSRAGTNQYKFVYMDDKGKLGTFSAHLANIKGNLFLDFFPDDLYLKENEFYRFNLLPVHTFAYVKQIEPTLQMSFPNPEWIKKFLNKNPGAIRHEQIESEIILTASTEELQAFWVKHLDTEGAFEEPSVMKRVLTDAPDEQPNQRMQPTANRSG
jgi:hypothetical protein